MNRKLGMIGAIINAVTVLLFAIFMAIDFTTGSFFICILLALSFVMMIRGLYSEFSKDSKTAGIIGMTFSAIYATLILIVYYTQCTTVINESLNEQASHILDYRYLGLMFNLDILGYGIMALSTFFIGLAFKANNKMDKALKILLLVHGIFFIGCLIMPMTGMFVKNDDSSSIGGIIALEFWCLYFLPIGILSAIHFYKKKEDEVIEDSNN